MQIRPIHFFDRGEVLQKRRHALGIDNIILVKVNNHDGEFFAAMFGSLRRDSAQVSETQNGVGALAMVQPLRSELWQVCRIEPCTLAKNAMRPWSGDSQDFHIDRIMEEQPVAEHVVLRHPGVRRDPGVQDVRLGVVGLGKGTGELALQLLGRDGGHTSGGPPVGEETLRCLPAEVPVFLRLGFGDRVDSLLHGWAGTEFASRLA